MNGLRVMPIAEAAIVERYYRFEVQRFIDTLVIFFGGLSSPGKNVYALLCQSCCNIVLCGKRIGTCQRDFGAASG